MQQVIDHCRSQQRSDWYCTFRRFVIEHPILDGGTLVDAELNELADLAPQLRAVYEPAPKGWSQGGELAQCGYCGQLLEPGRSPQSAHWRCRSSDCLSHPQPLRISRTWRVGDCYRLKSPFYYYVHRPGRAEVALEQEFQGDPRIVTQLWPDCDRYDLRVIFADGRVWGVDVKDWRSPAALGHWMDHQEHHAATGARSGHWAQRLGQVDFRAIAPDGSFSSTAELTLDGTTHWIGRVGAGKSTLMQVLAVWCARRGQRVTLVLGDTMTVLDWAAQFVRLGLRAAPLLGASQRDRHAQRFDARERRHASVRRATIADRWLSLGCPVDTWRDLGHYESEGMLADRDYPCQRLQAISGDRPTSQSQSQRYTCLAWGQCPTHQATRELVEAEIWVATAPALLYGQCLAPLSDRRMRYWEQMWRSGTLVIVDECDRVQVQLDRQFAPTERLEGPMKDGLLTRLQDRLGSMPGRSPLVTRIALGFWWLRRWRLSEATTF